VTILLKWGRNKRLIEPFMLLNLLTSMRYRGWTKNLLVFGALFFVPGAIFETGALLRSFMAFAAFCLIASGTYIINDIADKKRDREHPVKKNRPIASGKLPVGIAGVFGTLFIIIGFAISIYLDSVPFEIAGFYRVVHIRNILTFTLLAYLVMTLLYSLGLKRIPILDVLIIAMGFVMRAVAGAAVLNVQISQWLLLCTLLLSVYLALAKRRGEIVELGISAANHRENLADYSIPLIDQFLSITAATNIISYSLYTFLADYNRGSYLMVTIPMVIFGIFRYQALVTIKGAGANPEEILLKDRPIQIDILIWLISVVLILKFGQA